MQRREIQVLPLSQRENKLVFSRDMVDPATFVPTLSPEAWADVGRAADEIRKARERGAARMLTFGAHSIKNGLAPVLGRLLDGGWITHFATNGAGIIHDWEFAFQGMSGENVERYTRDGQFGIWNETGMCLNFSIILGAYAGRGYAGAVGELVRRGGLEVPGDEALREALVWGGLPEASDAELEKAAAAADLLRAKRIAEGLRAEGLADIPKSGWWAVKHAEPQNALVGRAVRADVPFTCHPMIGHDIIYTHPICSPAAIGRAAERDFLRFVESVQNLDGGVYLSIGSAVMSPMVFEKSLSMARNIARRQGRKIDDFDIHVLDLARATWDWNTAGEPPMDDPAYYLRFCKTFSRMGGRMAYCSADNRSWLVALLRNLEG